MTSFLSVVLLLLVAPSSLLAAEIWLRERVVKKHRHDILVTIRATPEHIGEKARPIEKDCNLHVPLRSKDIRVAILGGIKNACSQPERTPANYWSRKLKPLEGQVLEAEGVLRVWLEHPPQGGKRQCECDPLPRYTSSTPDHMVQLHPLTRLGGISFLEMTRGVQKRDIPFIGHRGGKLPSTLNRRKISIRRVDKEGEPYIAVKGSRTGFSHWTLLAVVMSVAEKRKDGHVFDVAVVHRDGFMERNLRALTIMGTTADKSAGSLEVNDEVVLFGIMRLNLDVIERKAGPKWKSIPMPYELIVLDIMK